MKDAVLDRYVDAFLPTFKAATTETALRDAIAVLVKHVEREARHRAERQVQACMHVVGESDQPLNL